MDTKSGFGVRIISSLIFIDATLEKSCSINRVLRVGSH